MNYKKRKGVNGVVYIKTAYKILKSGVRVISYIPDFSYVKGK